MTTTARLTALAAGAALALSGALVVADDALAQDLPADVDPSRLLPAALPGSATPVVRTERVRPRGGWIALRLDCPAGGPACHGSLAVVDLRALRIAGASVFALAAGEQATVGIPIGRKPRRAFPALVAFRPTGAAQAVATAGVVVVPR